MFYYSFDFGETTGFVFFDLGREKILSDAVPEDKILQFVQDTIVNIPAANAIVIVEQMPKEMPTDRNYVIAYQRMIKMTHYKILPGHWKPLARANKWKASFRTQHEKDAYNILRYHLLTKFNLDLGDLK